MSLYVFPYMIIHFDSLCHLIIYLHRSPRVIDPQLLKADDAQS